jgi:hypothetical protein
MMRVPYLFIVRLHYENRVPPIPFIAPGSPMVRVPYSIGIAPETGKIIGEQREARRKL